jgi:AmmeMemoRadiSam system protein B
MSAIRPAAVAGAFYPHDAGELAAAVAGCLPKAPRAGTPGAKAIIAPHAGLIYSGPVAGNVYAQLASRAGSIRRVVLAGPAHRVYVPGVAVPTAHAFATPLGTVAVDRAAIDAIRALPFVAASDRAHALEHSLEVHLPFLQSVLGEFTLVPLLVGDAAPGHVAALLGRLWGGPETLIVVSSDLSHYLPYQAARARDGGTARAIVGLDATLEPEDACGCAPINGLLRLARDRGLEARLVDLRNSGDTAGGRDQVVGYGAFAFHEAARG